MNCRHPMRYWVYALRLRAGKQWPIVARYCGACGHNIAAATVRGPTKGTR